MRLDFPHCHDEGRLEPRPEWAEPFDLETSASQALSDVGGRCVETGDERAEPAIGGFHGRSARFLAPFGSGAEQENGQSAAFVAVAGGAGTYYARNQVIWLWISCRWGIRFCVRGRVF